MLLSLFFSARNEAIGWEEAYDIHVAIHHAPVKPIELEEVFLFSATEASKRRKLVIEVLSKQRSYIATCMHVVQHRLSVTSYTVYGAVASYMAIFKTGWLISKPAGLF